MDGCVIYFLGIINTKDVDRFVKIESLLNGHETWPIADQKSILRCKICLKQICPS